VTRPIYLDYQATTPVDPRVFDAMTPYFLTEFGNASSTDHVYGASAAAAVEKARTYVADLIGAAAPDLIFTSGATESNNLAIIGAAEILRERGRHIITCATEHKAVLESVEHLARIGYTVSCVPVDRNGAVDPATIESAITSETILVSVMAANNEIGTITPLAEIGAITRRAGVLFHTDAAQAAAYVDLDVERDCIDLLSLSAHKMYGPKGVGALYVRRHAPRVRLAPLLHGGGHERGLRSGTLNVPGIVGMGAAAQLCRRSTDEGGRVQRLRDTLFAELQAAVGDVRLNGSLAPRLPNNLSLAIAGVSNRSLVLALRETVAFSTGSACTTTRVEPSHVLLALGYESRRAHETIRLSLGRFTTESDVRTAVGEIAGAVGELRQLSGVFGAVHAS
jgi:cysteine desulfurase